MLPGVALLQTIPTTFTRAAHLAVNLPRALVLVADDVAVRPPLFDALDDVFLFTIYRAKRHADAGSENKEGRQM